MNKHSAIPPVLLALTLLAVPALAAKSPAAQALGSGAAACHLATHLQAYSHGWDGESASTSQSDGCGDFGHVHCYGQRVSLWDTPKKGPHKVLYYAGNQSGVLNPGDEFQLVDVVAYKGAFYAQVRTYVNGYARLSGFVNADYIGCDCETYDARTAVPAYDSDETVLVE